MKGTKARAELDVNAVSNEDSPCIFATFAGFAKEVRVNVNDSLPDCGIELVILFLGRPFT